MALVSQDESGTPQTQSLGQVSLQAGGTAQFDFESQFGGANSLPNGYGHLTASFQGQDGDLILETGSVDQTKNYVFEVSPSQQADSASRTICFWSVEGSNDSMITIWNYKDVAQDLDLTLYYSGGHYLIPIHLEALEAYNLDMLMLIRSQASDPYGTLIPSNITSGSALLSSPGDELEKISAAVSASVYSARNATCGNICITCNGAAWMSYETSPVKVPVGGFTGATVQLAMTTGTVISNPPGGMWHTSNAAVVAVNSSGVHSGVSAGQATSMFTLTPVPVTITICGPIGLSCPTEGLTASAPADVSDLVVTSVSPLDLYVGEQGAFTITGSGFLSAGTPYVEITGGDVSLGAPQVNGDTTITVPFVVECDAVASLFYNLSISFPNGDGGSLLSLPFPVSVWMPNPPAPTINLNGSPLSGTPNVFVGQQIALTGTQSLPACMSLQSQQWTPPTASGTPIGGYVNADGTGPPDTTGGRVLGLPPANGANYTFYWTTPGNSLSTTYQYTMSATDANGAVMTSPWSPAVTASFNVTGPPSGASMTGQPYSQVTEESLPLTTGGTLVAFMAYGLPAPGSTVGSWVVPGSIFGITFAPSVDPGSGTYSYTQLVNGGTMTETVGTPTCHRTQGLDTGNPYAALLLTNPNPRMPIAFDGPGVQLFTNSTTTRTFNATMFLMWTSTIAGSIPVPIGYQTWAFSGTASQVSGGPWSVTTNCTPSSATCVGVPMSGFIPSSPSQSSQTAPTMQSGYPIWSGAPSTQTCP